MHVQLANGPRWESRPAPDLTDPVGSFAFPVSGIVSNFPEVEEPAGSCILLVASSS